jgi:ribosome-associated protein
MDEPSSQPDPPVQENAGDESVPAEVPKICLDQFLKTCGVATGGQAKQLIQGGEVLVNNEVETRRRKKLVPGDEVQLFDDVFVVALAADLDEE